MLVTTTVQAVALYAIVGTIFSGGYVLHYFLLTRANTTEETDVKEIFLL